jgi:hypothetical protein
MFARCLLVLLCASAAWAQVFSGQVLEDHSGTALPSAIVRVARVGERYLAAELETDREGRFQAAGLAPGEYRLEIQRTGYASTKLAATLTASGTSVVARLIKRGIIAGHVRDQQGQPIPGAVVFALPKLKGTAPLRPPGRSTLNATADASGEYRIRNLPPGDYIAVTSYGASTRAMGSSGMPGTPAKLGSGFAAYPTNSRPDTLTITSGEELRNIDFTVLARPIFNVSGKVDPKPENAFFILGLIDPQQPGLAVAIAESAADGTFKFTGVPEGNYRLVAATTARARNGFGFLLPEKPIFGATRVNIAAQDVTGLVVAPDAERTVTFNLKNSSGCPPAAQLELASLEDWGSQLTRTASLKAGEPTVVTGLAPARYALSTPVAGATCYLESERTLDLGEAAPPGPLDVVYSPAATLRGKLDSGTRPASGFRIALAAGADASTFDLATPDAQGRFAFPNLVPGRYRIAAFVAGARVEFSKMTEFEVRGGSNAEIDLAAPQEVTR